MVPKHRALGALGLNLRQAREKEGLTQEKLAERANLDPTYISGIERGVRNPSVLSLIRVSEALGFTAADLLKGVKA